MDQIRSGISSGRVVPGGPAPPFDHDALPSGSVRTICGINRAVSASEFVDCACGFRAKATATCVS